MSPALLGKHVGKKLKKKRRSFVANTLTPGATMSLSVPELGRAVGRALVKLHEFRAGDDWSDWTDPRKLYGSLDSGSRAGLAGKLVSNAETGVRIGKDLHRAITGDQGDSNSASAGNFKLTPNSRNTARITVGDDRRTRRKKYEWEKADTRRKIHKAILAVGAPLVAGAGIALHQKGGGGPIFKGMAKGVGVVAKETVGKAKDIGSGIRAGFKGEAFTPASRAKSPQSASMKVAEMIKASRESLHTPTPEAHGGPTVPEARPSIKMPEEPFKVVPKK